MDSIVESLHDLLDLPRPTHDPDRAAIHAQLDPLMDQIQDRFGTDFVDRFAQLYCELCASNDLWEFRMGFITGAKLMMEVLG